LIDNIPEKTAYNPILAALFPTLNRIYIAGDDDFCCIQKLRYKSFFVEHSANKKHPLEVRQNDSSQFNQTCLHLTALFTIEND
jgi:hypothetical protein